MISTLLALSTLLTYLRCMHLLANSTLLLTLAHGGFLLYTQKNYGQRAFLHSILNKAIRNAESALSFKFALKTYLFQLYS